MSKGSYLCDECLSNIASFMDKGRHLCDACYFKE